MLPRVRIRCTLAGLFCLALPAVAFAQDPDTSRQSSAEVVIDGEELGVIVSEAVGDIAAVLAGETTVDAAIEALLTRPLKPERE